MNEARKHVIKIVPRAFYGDSGDGDQMMLRTAAGDTLRFGREWTIESCVISEVNLSGGHARTVPGYDFFKLI